METTSKSSDEQRARLKKRMRDLRKARTGQLQREAIEAAGGKRAAKKLAKRWTSVEEATAATLTKLGLDLIVVDGEQQDNELVRSAPQPNSAVEKALPFWPQRPELGAPDDDD